MGLGTTEEEAREVLLLVAETEDVVAVAVEETVVGAEEVLAKDEREENHTEAEVAATVLVERTEEVVRAGATLEVVLEEAVEREQILIWAPRMWSYLSVIALPA